MKLEHEGEDSVASRLETLAYSQPSCVMKGTPKALQHFISCMLNLYKC